MKKIITLSLAALIALSTAACSRTGGLKSPEMVRRITTTETAVFENGASEVIGYDQNGIKLIAERFTAEGLKTHQFNYDKVEKIESIKIFNENGELSTTIIYTYEGENKSSSSTLNADGALITQCEYEYYDNGNIKKETTKNAAGCIMSESEYYEESSKIKSIKAYDPESNEVIYAEEYSDTGNNTKRPVSENILDKITKQKGDSNG